MLVETERDKKLNRCIRNTIRSFIKLHGTDISDPRSVFQKLMFGNLKAELQEIDWTHVSKSQQDDYDAKIQHLSDVIAGKNKSIEALVKKCKDAGLL